MKSMSQSIYSQLPETAETKFAKTVSELQSEVRWRKLERMIKKHLNVFMKDRKKLWVLHKAALQWKPKLIWTNMMKLI